MLLRLFMNMNVSVGFVLVCSALIKSAYNYTMRILGYLGRRAILLTYSNPFKTMALAILPFSISIRWCDKPSPIVGLGRWEA